MQSLLNQAHTASHDITYPKICPSLAAASVITWKNDNADNNGNKTAYLDDVIFKRSRSVLKIWNLFLIRLAYSSAAGNGIGLWIVLTLLVIRLYSSLCMQRFCSYHFPFATDFSSSLRHRYSVWFSFKMSYKCIYSCVVVRVFFRLCSAWLATGEFCDQRFNSNWTVLLYAVCRIFCHFHCCSSRLFIHCEREWVSLFILLNGIFPSSIFSLTPSLRT